MRMSKKITGVLLFFALLASCVAATENKDLPTKEEITDFIAGIPVSDNYIITVFEAVIDKKPTWDCDIWEDRNGSQILSLYYVAPDSAKGYGSIYFNELGKEISISGVEVELIESYVGEDISEENTLVETTSTSIQEQTAEEETQPVEEEVHSAEDERLDEYEERLAEYEKQLDEYKENIPAESEYAPSENYFEKYFKESFSQVQFAFDPVEKMAVSKTETVSAYITKNVSKNISEEYKINETLKSENITITPTVRVSLSEGEPESFNIIRSPPNSDGVQSITSEKTNIWDWKVTPLKWGKHTLILSVECLDNNTFEKFKPDIIREIEVEVSPIDYIKAIATPIDEKLKRIVSIIGSSVFIWAFLTGRIAKVYKWLKNLNE